MRPTVLVPASPDGLRPEVVSAILAAGHTVVVAPCRAEHDYWGHLQGAWQRSTYVLIVEHDVVVSEWILAGLIDCPAPWCCYPYEGGDETLLGCTRFRPSLLAKFPVPDPVGWRLLDQAVYAGLKERGFRPHVHLSPRPVHLH